MMESFRKICSISCVYGNVFVGKGKAYIDDLYTSKGISLCWLGVQQSMLKSMLMTFLNFYIMNSFAILDFQLSG